MAKIREFYFVPYGYGGQHGDRIEAVKMTSKEFEEISGKSCGERGGVYFKEYIEALYYTQD